MIVMTQNQPLIIRRNEALRTADNILLDSEKRLNAADEADFLSVEIFKRVHKAVADIERPNHCINI